jgi:formate hydrogenlyase subunit 6/NADH:ubiquinone oxidoreductase subunit I
MSFFTLAKTLAKSFFSKPATIGLSSLRESFGPITRGTVAISIDSCIFCGLCARRCPTDAISVSKEESSWGIARHACIQCSRCVSICPKQCLSMTQELPDVQTSKTVCLHSAHPPDNPLSATAAAEETPSETQRELVELEV